MKKEELLIGDLVRVKTDKDYILYRNTVCIIKGIESWQCDKLSDDVRGVQLMTLDRLYRTLGVNYSHLKEGASCFIETTCIKVSLNVEVVSPQALISVVPTVLYITL